MNIKQLNEELEKINKNEQFNEVADSDYMEIGTIVQFTDGTYNVLDSDNEPMLINNYTSLSKLCDYLSKLLLTYDENK